jgi:hypothetical protein
MMKQLQDSPFFKWLYTVLGIGVMCLLSAKAWMDVDWYWDTWLYHLPFAARIWDIIPENQFVFDGGIQHRFEGFALLGQTLMGGLWRLFNRIQATNLLSLGSLFLLVGFLWQRFRIPFYLSLFALLAVPIIQIHATISHVDLPGNACLTICLLLTWQLWADPDNAANTSRSSLWLFSLALIMALNIKLAYVLLCIPLGLAYLLGRLSLQRMQKIPYCWKKQCIFALLVALLACSTFIKNTLVYHNPFHGMLVKVGNWVVSEGEDFGFAMPDYLKNAPAPLRWGYSVLEIGRPPLTWSWDQHGVEGFTLQDYSPPSNTMGGYFNAYVFFLVALLVLQVWRYRTRSAFFTLVFMGILTVLTATLPMAHHLRYYSCWMMTLIACNLALLKAHENSVSCRLLSQWTVMPMILVVFAIVVGATQGNYLFPQGIGIETLKALLLKDSDGKSRLSVIQKPGDYCVRGGHPFAILYSPYFSPEKQLHYRVEDTGWPPSVMAKRSLTAWPLDGYQTQITPGLCTPRTTKQEG